MPTVHLLVVDGFADWEPALALTGLREYGGFEVKTVGLTPHPVRSMAGLRSGIDLSLSDLDAKTVETLLIPGSQFWEQGEVKEVSALIQAVFENNGHVAAISAGTLAVAHTGLLRGHRHTSNRRSFLQKVPTYQSDVDYVDELATRDGRLITASAIGYVEFARELFALLCVLSDRRLQDWYDLFRKAHPEAYADFQKVG